MKLATWRLFLLLSLLQLAATRSAAQDAAGAPALPADPARWINSGPLSLEMLAGKAALFWFFEES